MPPSMVVVMLLALWEGHVDMATCSAKDTGQTQHVTLAMRSSVWVTQTRACLDPLWVACYRKRTLILQPGADHQRRRSRGRARGGVKGVEVNSVASDVKELITNNVALPNWSFGQTFTGSQFRLTRIKTSLNYLCFI